ncbi:MAG: GntR family transcriptional regulator [Propionibacteriaceae bacterium]|nr:GntR family transcriptional regulator [Propionibacteriaceae bacterium]
MGQTALRVVALGEQLSNELRGRIVRGQIPAGTHLVEDSLAASYGVSRGPVRDALRTLLAEGLLESRRRGFYVRTFQQSDIDELYEIRGAAEQLAGRLAMERCDARDWEQAQVHLDEMRRHAEAGDEHAFAVADLAFHTEFYRNSGSARLLSLWRQYEPIFATLLDITNSQDADLRPSYHDHEILLQHLLDRDVASFSAALDTHLEGSHRRLSGAITQSG